MNYLMFCLKQMPRSWDAWCWGGKYWFARRFIYLFFQPFIPLTHQAYRPQQHSSISTSLCLHILATTLQSQIYQWHFPSSLHKHIRHAPFLATYLPSTIHLNTPRPQSGLGYTRALVCYPPSPSAPVLLHSRAEFTWWVIAAVSGRIETSWQVDTINDACSEGGSRCDGETDTRFVESRGFGSFRTPPQVCLPSCTLRALQKKINPFLSSPLRRSFLCGFGAGKLL